jgi:hypothetical protein
MRNVLDAARQRFQQLLLLSRRPKKDPRLVHVVFPVRLLKVGAAAATRHMDTSARSPRNLQDAQFRRHACRQIDGRQTAAKFLVRSWR